MNYDIKLYQRPGNKVVDQIIGIVKELTVKWFTENVVDDTRRDLLFQDSLCLIDNDRIVSFVVFTCWDGSIHITLMGTRPEFQRKGYGTILIDHFCKYIKTIGFNRVVVLTVPPDIKSSYQCTVEFYLKNGFTITKRYTEIWENGAIELVKELD